MIDLCGYQPPDGCARGRAQKLGEATCLESSVTGAAGNSNSVTYAAGVNNEHSEKTDSTAAVGTRGRVAQCITGVRTLWQEDFV